MSAAVIDRDVLRGRHRLLSRDFSRLWLASAASTVGDGVTLAAAPLLASHLTTDARLIGGVTVALTVPFVLFGLPAGLLTDRLDLRAAMIRVDFFRAGLMALLAAGVLGGWGGLPLLYLCMFLIGTGEVFFRNAAQLLVPAITPAAGLTTANARIMATQEAGNSFVGPLVGAALFALAFGLPFGLDAATFLCSALLLGRVRHHLPSPAATRNTRAELLAGVRWLARHRLLRTLALLSCGINTTGTAALAVLVVHARDVLHLGSFGYGVLLACQAAGAVLAARLAAVLSDRFGREWALVATAAMITIGQALIAVVASPYAVGVGLALFACAIVVWNVVVIVLRQTLVPQPLRGRVNSVYRLVAWGGLPVGAAAGGFLAAAAGTPAVYAVSAACMGLICLALVIGARRRWITR